MDFKNLSSIWKLKRFCITCMEMTFSNFCFSGFCFQFDFFFNIDFQMHKTHLKNLCFRDFVYWIQIIVLP